MLDVMKIQFRKYLCKELGPELVSFVTGTLRGEGMKPGADCRTAAGQSPMTVVKTGPHSRHTEPIRRLVFLGPESFFLFSAALAWGVVQTISCTSTTLTRAACKNLRRLILITTSSSLLLVLIHDTNSHKMITRLCPVQIACLYDVDFSMKWETDGCHSRLAAECNCDC